MIGWREIIRDFGDKTGLDGEGLIEDVVDSLIDIALNDPGEIVSMYLDLLDQDSIIDLVREVMELEL